jgi:hypothetical protein
VTKLCAPVRAAAAVCVCVCVCVQDEFYVLPQHSSFQEAFAEGGCLSHFSQVGRVS